MSGTAILAEALDAAYPALAGPQRTRLGNAIIAEIAQAIRRGDSIGTLRPLPGGSFEITRFTVERARGTSAE